MNNYRFVKKGSDWHIDLPEYIAQGGGEADLQLVDGADVMLDRMSDSRDFVELVISEEPFDNADILVLSERCDPFIGGGYYLMKEYKGEVINQTMWLCRVTEFVFGKLPERIFVKRIE